MKKVFDHLHLERSLIHRSGFEVGGGDRLRGAAAAAVAFRVVHSQWWGGGHRRMINSLFKTYLLFY